MKTPTLLLTAALLLTTAAAAPAQEASGPAPDSIPEGAYNRELKDLDGQGFFLSNLRGRVFVLNVWATRCVRCRSEIPELNKLREEYAAQGVEFVGLSFDCPERDEKAVREAVAELGMKYKVVWLDALTVKVMFPGNDFSVPQTFVVAADGRVVGRSVGFDPKKSPALWRRALDRALNPGPR